MTCCVDNILGAEPRAVFQGHRVRLNCGNATPYQSAALCNDLFSASMSRRHNDANILVMGGRVIGDVLALEILKTWLETPFEGGRHQRRLDMFDRI